MGLSNGSNGHEVQHVEKSVLKTRGFVVLCYFSLWMVLCHCQCGLMLIRLLVAPKVDALHAGGNYVNHCHFVSAWAGKVGMYGVIGLQPPANPEFVKENIPVTPLSF